MKRDTDAIYRIAAVVRVVYHEGVVFAINFLVLILLPLCFLNNGKVLLPPEVQEWRIH